MDYLYQFSISKVDEIYKFYLISLSLLIAVVASQNFNQATQFTTQQQQQHSDEHQADSRGDTISASATPNTYRARQYDYSQEEEEDEQPQYVRRQHPQQQLTLKQKAFKKQQLEEELAEEEPDRLALLLQKSNFHCSERTTGYYADESLGCEVFHYCQENQKHSWICPEGFTFHQVHLICMPPSGDNICEQSSKYTFVNDYLYKPLNMEEHQSKPNVTLRYSERFYPENFYLDERREYDEERQQPRQQYHQQASIRKSPVQHSTPTYNPSSTPLPYRVAAQQQQQNAYRTPEEINIPLQQRRPFFSSSTTAPRFEEEDEYSYEK